MYVTVQKIAQLWLNIKGNIRMKDLVNRFKRYLSDTLGITVTLSKYEKENRNTNY